MRKPPAIWDWNQRLKNAKESWAQLRKHDSLGAGRSTDRSFSFGSIEELAEGIEFGAGIEGWQIGEELASIRVRGRLRDYRITALSSFAEGRSVARRYFLDFDVLAAHCLIEERLLTPSVQVALLEFDREMASMLELYCHMIDRIWQFFGERDRWNFERLALWTMKNGDSVGLHVNALDGAFGAFLYGARERS